MTAFSHDSGHWDSPAHIALVVIVGVTVALCSGCGSHDTASTSEEHARTAMPACDVGRPGPPSIESVFVNHLPRSEFTIKEICAADVGPGLDDPGVVAALSDLAAGEITQTTSSPERTIPKVLVGTVKSGDGDAFVDAFLSRVGEDHNDTVTLGGDVVTVFQHPAARATRTPRRRWSLSATSRRREAIWVLPRSGRR